MDKHSLSERDICTKYITPALRKSGWRRICGLMWFQGIRKTLECPLRAYVIFD
jgi:hypothetical protein